MELLTLLNTTRFARYGTLIMLALSLLDIADYLFLAGIVNVSMAAQDTVLGITSVTDFVLLGLLIVNLRWIYVAAKYYQNRAEIGAIRPAWAVWSNFIPFINLWSPYVQIRRIWGVSAGLTMGYPGWLRIWWATWVFQFVAVLVFVGFAINFENLEYLDTWTLYVTPLFIITDVLGTALFYLIITKIGGAHRTDADVFN